MQRSEVNDISVRLPTEIVIGYEHLVEKKRVLLERMRIVETVTCQQEIWGMRNWIDERIDERTYDTFDTIWYRINGQLGQLYLLLQTVREITANLNEAYIDAGVVIFKAAGGIDENLEEKDIRDCYRIIHQKIELLQHDYERFMEAHGD